MFHWNRFTDVPNLCSNIFIRYLSAVLKVLNFYLLLIFSSTRNPNLCMVNSFPLSPCLLIWTRKLGRRQKQPFCFFLAMSFYPGGLGLRFCSSLPILKILRPLSTFFFAFYADSSFLYNMQTFKTLKCGRIGGHGRDTRDIHK